MERTEIKFGSKADMTLALCLLHAAFLSITAWVRIGPHTASFNAIFLVIWEILLFCWPLWLIALVIIWRLESRKLWSVFVPIGLSILILMPALCFVRALGAFGH